MSRRFILALFIMLMNICIPTQAAPWPIDTPAGMALVDEMGHEILESGRYEAIFTVFDGKAYAAGDPGAYALFDAEGSRLTENCIEMAYDYGDGIIFRQNGACGAMSYEGEVLLDAAWTELVYDGQGGFLATEGSALDEQPDALIHISADGEAVLTGAELLGELQPVQCDRMPFCGTGGSWGYVNGAGDVVLEPLWRYAGPFEEDLAIVGTSSGMGVVNTGGEAVIEPRYRWLERGDGVFVAASSDGKALLFDREGKLLFEVEAVETDLIGKCLVARKRDLTAVYDSNGQCLYEGGPDCRFQAGVDGQIIVIDGTWGEACQFVINNRGERVSDRYQRLQPLCHDRYAYMTMKGTEYYSEELDMLKTSWDYESVRYGLMDGRGRVMTRPEYEQIQALDDAHILLISRGKVSLADVDGAVIRQWTAPETVGETDEYGASD